MVIVPFDPKRDLIMIDARIAGHKGTAMAKMALDTACGETLIIPAVLDRIGYGARDGEDTASVSSALGREVGYRLRVARFDALGYGFDGFRVNVHDLPDDCGLDGLLGLNFLRQFNYEIRSKEGTIRIEPA